VKSKSTFTDQAFSPFPPSKASYKETMMWSSNYLIGGLVVRA
jgi:hypothetical protein